MFKNNCYNNQVMNSEVFLECQYGSGILKFWNNTKHDNVCEVEFKHYGDNIKNKRIHKNVDFAFSKETFKNFVDLAFIKVLEITTMSCTYTGNFMTVGYNKNKNEFLISLYNGIGMYQKNKHVWAVSVNEKVMKEFIDEIKDWKITH